jgi:hypothetical protein
MIPEELAQLFHETYERLAPDFGYKTREASAKPWSDVPGQNKNLMIAVAGEILKNLQTRNSEGQVFRSDELHSLMELVDQQVHAIPVSQEAEGYIHFLKSLYDKVTTLWTKVLPGQEAVFAVREQPEE